MKNPFIKIRGEVNPLHPFIIFQWDPQIYKEVALSEWTKKILCKSDITIKSYCIMYLQNMVVYLLSGFDSLWDKKYFCHTHIFFLLIKQSLLNWKRSASALRICALLFEEHNDR